MNQQLPRIALVLLVAASLTITLGGARAISDIIGPTVLALVLTITVHPVRRRLVRRGLPEWLVSLVTVISVYLLLLGVTVAVMYSIGRLAALIPQYTEDLDQYVADVGAWLEDLGLGADQIQAMADAFDAGSLVGVATDIFGAALGLVSNLFFIVTVAALHGLRHRVARARPRAPAGAEAGPGRRARQLRHGHPDLHGRLRRLRVHRGGDRRGGALPHGGARSVRLGGAGLRHQLHPQHRLRHRRDPPAAIALLEGGPEPDAGGDRGLLRDQLRHPVHHPAPVRRRRRRPHPDHHHALPGLLGLAPRSAGSPPGGAAQPARACPADRGGPRRTVGTAPGLRPAARRPTAPRGRREQPGHRGHRDTVATPGDPAPQGH